MNRKDLLEAVAFYALVVMTMIEQDGENIIPHLIDSDDNPGQFLRDLLIEGDIDLKDSLYFNSLSSGKQIQYGGYTEVEDLITRSKYKKDPHHRERGI